MSRTASRRRRGGGTCRTGRKRRSKKDAAPHGVTRGQALADAVAHGLEVVPRRVQQRRAQPVGDGDGRAPGRVVAAVPQFREHGRRHDEPLWPRGPRNCRTSSRSAPRPAPAAAPTTAGPAAAARRSRGAAALALDRLAEPRPGKAPPRASRRWRSAARRPRPSRGPATGGAARAAAARRTGPSRRRPLVTPLAARRPRPVRVR